MSNFYNSIIKNRFLTENDLNESQIDKWKLIFSKTKPQEEILQKDIYQMNKQESESLIHLLNLRSVQHVNMHISNLKHYIYWCDRQGLVPHHVNYFEGLGDREVAKTFVSNQAVENQIISKKKLELYTNELLEADDFQGALIINLLFMGITLDKFDEKCELRNILIKNIDFENKTVQTNKRTLNMNDELIDLIRNAISQEEMINLMSIQENNSRNRSIRRFNNFDFLLNSRRIGENISLPTPYSYIAKKIREIGCYINNPHINASYLNLSGIIEHVKNNYNNDKFEKNEIYEELVDTFKLDISKESLRQKLMPFLT